MKFIKLIVFLQVCIFICSSMVALAKPMNSPSIEEAIKSDLIVIAEYKGYKPQQEKIEYFVPPIAKYSFIKMLKGNNVDKEINLIYEFQDGSACIEKESWKFSEELMPVVGSKWILFLKCKDGEYYSTYRGDYGRWRLTDQNYEEVTNLINDVYNK
ncbi:MAG: hypothetical protein LLG02_12865 [Pelosinus sp.]|nr:hypothetical protein [Pelosinus sp.]